MTAITKPFTGNYPITNDYRAHLTYSNAPGIDYALPHGTPIRAAASGKVTWSQWGTRGGRYLIIDHTPAARTNRLLTLYSHLFLFYVCKGEYVKQGEIIALSDDTGSHTTGPHLHFAVKQAGKWIDPEPVLGHPRESGDPQPLLEPALDHPRESGDRGTA